MGTVPQLLVRWTASPAYADFGGFELGSRPRRRLTQRCVFRAPIFRADGGGLSVDILLDVISRVESALWTPH
jgi:hypothetical protein